MSIETFARESQMNFDEAKDFLERFFENFSTLRLFLDQTKQRLTETGRLQSLLGRPFEIRPENLKSQRRKV